MEKLAPIANRSYEDFDPVCKWRREDGRDTIELHIPGFKREHVRIQINHLGFMVISGEYPLLGDGTRRRRFKKEIELPTYSNVDAIHANFMQNILSVIIPKKIPPIHQEIQEIIEEEKETNQKSMKFEERGMAEDTETITKETLEAENSYTIDDKTFVNNDVGLTPETTREIALKFMVMIIVILIIVSYVEDISKNLLAQAQSYFQD